MHATPVLINRLSRLIGERRLTVSEVAQGSGVSRRALHEIYHDKTKRVDLETLNRLCSYFEVGPGDIFEYRRAPADPPAHPSSADAN